MEQDRPLCAVCGTKPVHAKGVCITCYQYQRRNGTERTEDHVVRHGQRVLERWMSE